jgi:subtilase family serine protease
MRGSGSAPAAAVSAAGLLVAAGLLAAVAPPGPVRAAAVHAVPGPATARAGMPPVPARGALAGAVRISPGWRLAVQAASSGPPTTRGCRQRFGISCYQPFQLRRAYGLPVLLHAGISGRGQTIAVVDSFGSPTVRHDLAVFDRTFHIPPPPSLRVIQPAGQVPPYQPVPSRVGWAGETDLDVEWAHVMAPGASILVVETPTAENEGTTGFPEIVIAEKYVISHRLSGVISQSFSATEQTFPSRRALLALRGAYLAAWRAGITVLAASGDSGAAGFRYDGATYYLYPVTSWPGSDPLVTGVGGTQLRLSPAGIRTAPDRVWNDTYDVAASRFFTGSPGPSPLASGGGKSVIFPRPAYQDGVADVTGSRRGVPDISMSASCDGAVDVYQSFPGLAAGWYPTCGTSEATPLFAGVVALAGQVAGHPLGLINPALYALAARGSPGITDVTSGGNSVSFTQGGLRTVPGFPATRGYDLASGLGTVNAPALVYALARSAR